MIRMISLGCCFKIASSKCYFFCLFLMFISLSFGSLVASAGDASLSGTGFYMGARLGYSYNHNSCADMVITCDREDIGYGLFAGYGFTQRLALEVSATELGDTAAIYPDIKLNGELVAVDVSVKYRWPIYKKIRGFGKVGAAYWDGKVTGWDTVLSDSGVRPALGVGVEFPLFNRADGRIEYHYFDQLGNRWMGYTDANLIGFSLVWKFSAANSGL